jgi:apolipoprotein N-acyltransferase
MSCFYPKRIQDKLFLTGTAVLHRFDSTLMHRSQASVSRLVKPSLTAWAESFIFAGSSALLLLIANLFTHYWYFSFFALVPFLYRIIKASPRESLRLGFLLGLSYFGALTGNLFIISPLDSALEILSGTVLFTLFGWSVGRARQRWGFNPSLIAVLWVGLEIGLVKLGFTQGFFGERGASHPFLHGFLGLFGFLAVSAIIVLLNSLLVLAVIKSLEVKRPRWKARVIKQISWGFSLTRNLFAEKVYIVPEGRAPPFGEI